MRNNLDNNQKPTTIWDKTTQTDNKLTITNRFAAVIQRVRETYNVTEGKAIEGLSNNTYSFEDTLKQLKQKYHDI